MDIDLSQFKESFFAECGEHIGTIEEGLLELEAGSAEPERLHAIFRAAHSVKGAAGTFGWTAIVRLTHAMEDLLDRMRSGTLEASPQLIALLLSGVDEVKAIMSRRDSGDDFATNLSEDTLAMVSRLNLALDDQRAVDFEAPGARALPEREEQHKYEIDFIPSSKCFEKGIDPLQALVELADFGMMTACELDVDRLPRLGQMDPAACYLGWKLKLTTSLDEAEVRMAFALIDGDAEVTCAIQEPAAKPAQALKTADVEAPPPAQAAAIANRPAVAAIVNNRGAQAARQSIRVSAEKVDHLIDLTGELIIAYSMANQVLANLTPESLPRLRDAMAAMERGTRELQERVMSVRMLPAASVFQRFPRLVYDTAASTGKQIALQISGEETELDKTVAEQLLDPLTHLVRNSADHGIESPEERRLAGKPEQGLITLKAFHQSGKVVIEVSDDGKGLDPERIRSKAIARGLIRAGAELNDGELHQLIFTPGFSTRDEVSDLSGRGVGMDVVKRNVESLSGTIRLESTPGKGTVVRLSLPLTLAIIDGLLLRVGEQSFALPFTVVVESIRPKPAQLVRVHTGLEGAIHTALVLRSETLPLLSLASLFNIPGGLTDPALGLVVIVESGSRKIALLADDILGHQQFVVKSVEKNFRRVEGAMGATILGDGTVALIIDASALWEMQRGRGLLAA
jgi:two-component system chemotaxis sensor kinase CheA